MVLIARDVEDNFPCEQGLEHFGADIGGRLDHKVHVVGHQL
jgi:hypothetical protein